MGKFVWLALLLLAVLSFVAACPRDKDGDTEVVITEDAPAGDAAVVHDETAGGAVPDVNVDVNVEGSDASAEGGEGGQAEGDATAADAADGAATDGDTLTSSDSKPATGTTKVKLVTTKGDVELTIHPEWDPVGAEHFLMLVRAGYYNGSPWFRVLPNFVAQTGVSPDRALQEKYAEQKIKDSPVVKGNAAGTVAFAKPGLPDSRSTMFFVNLVDNSRSLDPQGFSAFAEVTSGMDVVLEIFPADFQDQMRLTAPGGIDAFREAFPQGDFITTATVVE